MTTFTSKSTFESSLDIRALRTLLEMPRESRARLLCALVNEQIEQPLIELLAIAENPDASEEDKASARATISETLQYYGCREAHWASQSSLEPKDVGQNPDADRVSQQMDSQEERFATKLRELMKARGLTQVELAKRSDCTQPAISQILSRRCRPQKRTILKLADALELAPADLWPDLDVADILDTVAAAQTDNEPLSAEEAAAIDRAVNRGAGQAGKALPKFKR